MVSGLKLKERELKKERVLLSAEKIFGKKEYESVNVNEISKDSQVCLQVIYDLFGSKKELYFELVKFRIEKFSKATKEAINRKMDSIEVLKIWVEKFFEFNYNFPQFLPILLKEKLAYEWGREGIFSEEIRKYFRREERRLDSYLRKAVKEKKLRKLPISYLRRVLFYFLISKLEFHFRTKKKFEVKKCVEEVLIDFLNGLGC